jgi:hypothetical protein
MFITVLWPLFYCFECVEKVFVLWIAKKFFFLFFGWL